MFYLLKGGLMVPLVFDNGLLFSKDRGSKSSSWSNSLNNNPSNLVPTLGVFSKFLGGTGGAKKQLYCGKNWNTMITWDEKNM